jgi:hypothetical protein
MRAPGFVADFSLGPLARCYRSASANRASSVAGVMLHDYEAGNCDPCWDPNCPGTCPESYIDAGSKKIRCDVACDGGLHLIWWCPTGTACAWDCNTGHTDCPPF